MHRYLGDNTACTICLESFYHNEEVYRINCNHIFHVDCWNHLIFQYPDNTECPNCRGPGIVKSLFKYIGPATSDEVRESARRAEQLHRRQDDVSDYADAHSHGRTSSNASVAQSSTAPQVTTTFMASPEEHEAWMQTNTDLPVEEWAIQQRIESTPPNRLRLRSARGC